MEPIRLPICTDDIEDTILGRVLLAGRLVVTMRSKLTGVHMTIQFQGKAKVAGRWRSEPFPLASHVFIDVPQSGDGGFNDKVGTLYPAHSEMRSAGMFWPDRTADPARVWCAWRILEICAGLAEMETDSYEIMVATHCYRCGRELTEPESIEAGLGPKCRGIVSAEYGTRHQAKQKVLKREVEEGARPALEPAPDNEATRQQIVAAKLIDELAGEPHTPAHITSTGDLSDLL